MPKMEAVGLLMASEKEKKKKKKITKKMKAGLDAQDTSSHRPGLVLLI